MKKFLIALLIINIYPIISYSMENKPYHHLQDGTFRNPEGSPQRDSSFNWSFKIFNEEKKKLNMNIPDDHVIKKEIVEVVHLKHIQQKTSTVPWSTWETRSQSNLLELLGRGQSCLVYRNGHSEKAGNCL